MRHLLKLTGVLLICFGIFGFVYKYYPYKTEQNIAAVGPFQVEVEHNKYIYFPSLLSGLSIIAGAVLVFLGRRKVK